MSVRQVEFNHAAQPQERIAKQEIVRHGHSTANNHLEHDSMPDTAQTEHVHEQNRQSNRVFYLLRLYSLLFTQLFAEVRHI